MMNIKDFSKFLLINFSNKSDFENICLDFKKENIEFQENFIEKIIFEKFYISLIFLDFTFLNNIFETKVATLLKEEIIKILKENVEDKKIEFFNITSGKIFIFTQKLLDKNDKEFLNNKTKQIIKDWIFAKKNNGPNKKELDKEIDILKNENLINKDLNKLEIENFAKESFFEKLNLKEKKVLNKKLIYIIDCDNFNKNFVLGPFNYNLIEIFKKCLSSEIVLKKLRISIKDILDKYKNFTPQGLVTIDENDFYKNSNQILEGFKIENKLDDDLENNLNNLFFLNENFSENIFDKKNFNRNNLKILIKKNLDFLNQLEKNFDSSFYIKNAINCFKKIYEYNYFEIDKNFNKIYNQDLENLLFIARKNLIKYLIWKKMQELLFLGFKIEKVNLFVEKRKNTSEPIKIFPYDLRNWFDSTFLYFINLNISSKKREIANNIKNKILELNNLNLDNILDESEKKKIVLEKLEFIRENTRLFFDDLEIQGLFNIPFEKVNPSNIAINYFKDLFATNFGIGYETKKLEEWLKQDFIKENYFLFVKDPNLLFKGLKFLNKDLIENSTNLKFHGVFLEIDGFNSYNTFYFPNDSDKIMGQIFDKIFKILDLYLIKAKKRYKDINDDSFFAPYLKKDLKNYKKSIMSSCVCACLGDEFFFGFLTNSNLKEEELKSLTQMFKIISLQIVNLCKNCNFLNSYKIEVSTKEYKAGFRKILQHNVLGQIPILTQVGVTGVGIYNQEISFQEDKFKDLIKILENNMKDSKNNKELKSKFKWIKN